MSPTLITSSVHHNAYSIIHSKLQQFLVRSFSVFLQCQMYIQNDETTKTTSAWLAAWLAGK